jgi:hypothetical protein
MPRPSAQTTSDCSLLRARVPSFKNVNRLDEGDVGPGVSGRCRRGGFGMFAAQDRELANEVDDLQRDFPGEHDNRVIRIAIARRWENQAESSDRKSASAMGASTTRAPGSRPARSRAAPRESESTLVNPSPSATNSASSARYSSSGSAGRSPHFVSAMHSFRSGRFACGPSRAHRSGPPKHRSFGCGGSRLQHLSIRRKLARARSSGDTRRSRRISGLPYAFGTPAMTRPFSSRANLRKHTSNFMDCSRVALWV